VARRVVDGAILHLIKMWLEAPVEETDERGNKHRSTRNRDEGRGSPQGSPISPLLSNLYMLRFVLGWKKLGHEKRWKAYIVNYGSMASMGRSEWRTVSQVPPDLGWLSFIRDPTGAVLGLPSDRKLQRLDVTARFKRASLDPLFTASRLFAEVLEPFDRFKDSAGFLDFDAEPMRAPGTLPIRASTARTRSQAR
jgi:hypothetical protein